MNRNRLWILFLLFHFVLRGFTQEYKTGDAVLILSDKNADLTFPAWSEDGNLIFYQTDKNGNRDIYAYDLKADSTMDVATTKYDEQHPVWWPGHNGVVYDKTVDGMPFLFYYRFDKKTTAPLFNRTIKCKQPSFDPDGRLVAFSGYDRETNRWQIFTYDFIYDNLNRLTKGKQTALFPVFSPKGNKLLYQTQQYATDTTGTLFLINWYGQPLKEYETAPLLKATFTPNEWRIIYVSGNKEGCRLESMRKDGSSVYILTERFKKMCCPAFSPDGKKLAVSIKQGDRYEIYIFNTKE